METYDNIYETICRLCLLRGDSDNMVSLIDDKSENGLSIYGKTVKQLAQITIEKNDCLPKYMCAKCLILLKLSISFKSTCESSDEHLNNIKISCHKNRDIFKEKIVEFIMFRQLFPEETSKISFKRTKKCKIEDTKIENPNIQFQSENTQIKPIISVSENDCKVFDTDSNHFDDVDDSQNLPNSESDDDSLLKKIETIVETNASYIDSDYEDLKLKRRKKHIKKPLKPLGHRKRVRKNVNSFECPICEKVLTTSQTYRCHMQKHKGYRFICEHCGKGAPTLSQLQFHLVARHDTGPSLQCSHCPFKAPRKIELIEHERLHTGERPFACEKCGLTFRRRAIWKKHLIYHAEKKVQCTLCPRKFYQRSDMLSHCNNVHNRVYVYACSKCDATYAKSTTVRRHMTEKHGVPREAQGRVARITKGGWAREQ